MNDPASLDDLLARVGLGDRSAFRQLYSATSSRLFAVALRILGRRDLAEDVLQDAFVNVWHHAARYAAERSRAMTWLTSIVRNRALDVVRSPAHRSQYVQIGEDEDDPVMAIADERPEPLALLLEAADLLRLRGCLDALDAAQQKSIALAYYEGLSHTELAAALGAPLGTVKAWIRRGLEKLRKCLEP
jgi:RNA polymerase sigma-70 factor (ECF subfamily)